MSCPFVRAGSNPAAPFARRPAAGWLLLSAVAAFIPSPALSQEVAMAAPNSAAESPLPQPHIHRPDAPEEDAAFSLDVVYTFDVLGNVSGGLKRAGRYLDNLDVIAQADLEALVGWKGARAQVYGLYNNGVSFSPLVGDAQVTSNIETGVQAVRLYEAWLEQDFSSIASLKLGLYDLNSEFDALDASGLFLNSAHGIGTEIAQTGENGPSIFPSTSLAARLQVTPAEGWVLRAAVLDGVPNDPDRPKRTVIRLGNGDGALLVGEVQAPLAGGRLLVGHWRYTAEFERLDGSIGRGNAGTYIRGEFPLLREAGTTDQGVDAFFRFGTANGEINQFDRLLSGGVAALGALPGRDFDSVGISFATAFTSGEWRNLTGGERSETAFELTYRAQLTDWLAVQPNVQYVVNPRADPSISNALVLGLRTELSWGLRR